MPGAPVVPLPVLVERVHLHPPPGVGHRAARGPGHRPRRSRPGRRAGEAGAEAERRPQAEGSRASLPPLAAAGPRCRPHGPLPGRAVGRRLSSPPGPRRYCPAPASPAVPRGGGAQRFAASRPAAVQTGGAGHCPAPAPTMMSNQAASRAATAAASSGRRRHVFLPYTWPCHRSRRLRSALRLQVSHADRRLPQPQLLPLRGRLREPPGAERPRLSEISFLRRRCRRLFRLPHGAKAAAILVRPSIAARGATQAAAAGAAH